MNTSQVSRRTRLAALAARIARELDLPFVSATMDETLQPRDFPHVLFRSNTDGTITFAVVGVLPSCSLYREQPTSKLVDTVEHWLEGVLIANGRARIGTPRAFVLREKPVPEGVTIVPLSDATAVVNAVADATSEPFGAALREMYPKKKD